MSNQEFRARAAGVENVDLMYSKMDIRLIWLLLLTALAAAACSPADEADPNEVPGPSDVISFGGQGPDGDGLYFVRPDGLGLTLVAREAEPVTFPVWSPAGGRIVYMADGVVAATLRMYDFGTMASTTVSSIALVGEDGPSASWSPNGRRLAFAELAGDDGRIRVFDVAGGELVEFPLVVGLAPDWAPDGDFLAFVRVGEERGLYVMAADGGEPELLVEGQGELRNPHWSPDGSRIVATERGEDGEDTLLIVERATGAAMRLSGLAPAWSPDGRLLAFSALSESGQTDLDVFSIEVAALDAEEKRPLGQSVTRDLWTTWSPDGSRVAFLSQVDRQTAFICLVTLEPEARDCLSLPGVLPTAPAWSPK